jgi:hypothetical protein
MPAAEIRSEADCRFAARRPAAKNRVAKNIWKMAKEV